MRIMLAWATCFLCLTGCMSEKKGDNVVVEFKGGSLTIEDLEAHYEILKRKARHQDDPERLTPEYILDHAVNMELIIAKGLKEKLHLDPRVRAQIHGFMSDLFLKIMQETLVPKINRESFTEDEVWAYFKENIGSYRTTPSYRVRVLRHEDPEFLAELKKRIEKGDETFASAALNHSTDEKTKEKSGDTGMRPLSRFRRAWRDAVEHLAVNEISAPTQIKDSYYLFQVTEKTEGQEPSFDEKKAYVRNDLLYSRYRNAWRDVYDRLRKEFSLTIHQDNSKRFYDLRSGK
jgi:hypothetical protein